MDHGAGGIRKGCPKYAEGLAEALARESLWHVAPEQRCELVSRMRLVRPAREIGKQRLPLPDRYRDVSTGIRPLHAEAAEQLEAQALGAHVVHDRSAHRHASHEWTRHRSDVWASAVPARRPGATARVSNAMSNRVSTVAPAGHCSRRTMSGGEHNNAPRERGALWAGTPPGSGQMATESAPRWGGRKECPWPWSRCTRGAAGETPPTARLRA